MCTDDAIDDEYNDDSALLPPLLPDLGDVISELCRGRGILENEDLHTDTPASGPTAEGENPDLLLCPDVFVHSGDMRLSRP